MAMINRRDFLITILASGAILSLPEMRLLAADKPTEQGSFVTEHVPVLAQDNNNTIWMAYVTQDVPNKYVQIEIIKDGVRKKTCHFQPPTSTGVGPPAIAPLKNGCIVVFSVELEGQWQIAYCFLDKKMTGKISCQYLPVKGTSNISPTLAVNNDTATVLWESNHGNYRRIHSCHIDVNKCSPSQPISFLGANSYNPSIVALSDGTMFAAWDSCREHSANIYGSWYRNHHWQKEQRITAGERIERHPRLAAWHNNVWMTWQAQSYHRHRLNNPHEQRIVVAQLDKNELLSPLNFFDKVSSPDRLLMRPQIIFDPDGRLWLTASLGLPSPHAGWNPVVWQYSGKEWTKMQYLSKEQGRWHPVPVIFSANQETTVITQNDNLPQGYDNIGEISHKWYSKLTTNQYNEPNVGTVSPLNTSPLVMPETSFSLKEKIEKCSAELPRTQWKTKSGNLSLFWGDLHEHTNMSVCNRRRNPPAHDLYANLRDIEKLDFCAITDHDYNFDPPQWAQNGEEARANHDPERFITFLAQEWTSTYLSTSGGYGHRNLIFLDPYHGKFYNSFDNKTNPKQLWEQLRNVEFICIPHQLADWEHKGGGNPPTNWDYVDEFYQPIAEIFQVRGSYEYLGCPRQARRGMPIKGNYLQDAWAKGIIIGVIASSDHGGGSGKAGVWAKGLSRKEIFKAIRARHTFGTSGAKMALQFSSGDAIMGDKVKQKNGSITFAIKALARNNIDEVVIFRNNEIVYKTSPNINKCTLKWTDPVPLTTNNVWYYARIQSIDKEIAWSSPIWFYA